MFEKILKKIKPTEREEKEIKAKVNKFLGKLNKNISEGHVVVGGSFAKGTWLSGQHDIDVFVQFSTDENISSKLEKAVKKSFKKYEVVHGSRDYFIVDFEELSFEIIPILKINYSREAKNITDISPLHVEWVKNNLNDRLKDEVRLAKHFCKANRIYGAETYIKGFHGYALEILIVYYGSFLNLVKHASRWRYNTLIYTSHNEFFSSQEFPLTLIDPVNFKRNAASSLSCEKFELFVRVCKEFNKKKSLGFFKPKKISRKFFDIILKIIPLKGFSDVSGTKVLKVFEHISKSLDKEGFTVLNSDWEFDDVSFLYFKVKNKTLPKLVKHYGPPVKFTSDLENFRNKYKNYNVENGRAYVLLNREYVKVRDFINHLLKDKDVKSMVKSIKLIN